MKRSTNAAAVFGANLAVIAVADLTGSTPALLTGAAGALIGCAALTAWWPGRRPVSRLARISALCGIVTTFFAVLTAVESAATGSLTALKAATTGLGAAFGVVLTRFSLQGRQTLD